MENKEKKTNKPEQQKDKVLSRTYHKIPDDVFNTVNQMLLTVTCKLSDGIKVLNAFQKSEIISE